MAAVSLFSDTLAYALAFIAALSAAGKVADWRRSLAATRSLLSVSTGLAPLGWGAALMAEMAGAVLLLWPPFRVAGGGIMALLWGVYALALFQAVAAGRVLEDCGCHFGRKIAPSSTTAWRAAGLAILALLVCMVPPSVLPTIATVFALMGGAVLFILYLAAEQIEAVIAKKALS